MELEFVKEGTMSVATFEATSDFNLHIEKAKESAVNFYQTSSEETEDIIETPDHLDMESENTDFEQI